MAIEDYMDEARGIAAHAWCDAETSHLVMIPELAEAFARRLAAWMDNAAEFCRNMEYYRGLLDQCAENLGPLRPKVFVQDDGGIVDEPLRAKLPELVAELATHARRWMLVEQAVNESNWQPIETAPKGNALDVPRRSDPRAIDSPDILLFCKDGIFIGHYDFYYHPGFGHGASDNEPPWRTNVESQPIFNPTHWMPLPSPPVS